ncbi:MAG TPA: IgGFc-binding protein [Myxococcales bacterium]|nr:IgGFc-binding protein [Myxococcales bacterium]
MIHLHRKGVLGALVAFGFAAVPACQCGAGVAGVTGTGGDGGSAGTNGGSAGSSGGGSNGGTGAGNGGSSGNPDGGCGLQSCQKAHATCGPIGDGCGGVLQCGSCTAPETCGGGGTPSVCGGHAGCVPRTCADAGASCGPIADGCGNLVQCGSCTAPATCGGAGVPNVCGKSGEVDGGHLLPDGGCAPLTCEALNVSCGPAGDGCGGTLDCGGCDAGTCGGGGIPSVCGSPQSACVPATCASLHVGCGAAGDGCGNLLDCGGCDAGSCGGGGVAGQCGSPPVCQARTCVGAGATCGILGDGCGNLLQCGNCNAPDICGGAGIPYVCGDGSGADGGGCVAPTVSCNTDAGAICTDVQSDSSNCGSCGNACPASFVCSAGTCTPQCTGALTCNTDAGEVCVGDHCANACDSALTGTSSVGCEFWPTHLWNTEDGAGYDQGPFGVVASNTSTTATATVTLEDANGVIQTQSVPPGQAALFSVPNARNKLALTQDGISFHLRSDVPIAAYEYNPVNAAQAFCGSADLLLPTHSLASYYFVVSYIYDQATSTKYGLTPPLGQGYLAVVGTQPNTSVQITVPVATSASANGAIAAIPANGTLNLTIGQGEAVEIAEAATLEDITGATITSDKPVVAFGGSGATTVPDTAAGGDHFEAQLFPTAAWGTAYECEKYEPRSPNDVDHWKIVAGQNGTVVTLSDPTIAPTMPNPFAAGQVFEFDTAESFDLTATQPVLVAHYLEAWGALSGQYNPAVFPGQSTNACPNAGGANDSECVGDANMTLAIPTAQYLSSYVFYTPSSYAWSFVDLIAPVGASITLDGVAAPALTPIGGGTYGLAQVPVTAGVHSASGDKPFGLTLYGYDYGISYTCVGGLNLGNIGFSGNPGSCTPLTCADQNIQCGPAGNGCGGQIESGCGGCAAPQTCGGGGVPGVCGGGCVPETCGTLSLSCGPAGDGCGGVLDCGECDAGTCGGGGTRGVCGSPGPCVPRTCLDLGYDCGPAGDGCGGLIDGGCGSCSGFEGSGNGTCGGGGIPGVCGNGAHCTPLTCVDQKISCGPAGDGCGNVIQCGGCDAGTCGGGGTPGVCGSPTCKPLTCAGLGYDCGPAGDGCGGLLQCGSCDAGTCGGGGQPNVCGNVNFH